MNNYDEFFNDIDFPLGVSLTYPLTTHAPNVTVHCLYGTGKDTAESFTFSEGEFPDTQPKITYGDGDGTVNIRGLQACSKWKQRQLYFVTLKQYPSVDHSGVLSDENVHNYVKTLLI